MSMFTKQLRVEIVRDFFSITSITLKDQQLLARRQANHQSIPKHSLPLLVMKRSGIANSNRRSTRGATTDSGDSGPLAKRVKGNDSMASTPAKKNPVKQSTNSPLRSPRATVKNGKKPTDFGLIDLSTPFSRDDIQKCAHPQAVALFEQVEVLVPLDVLTCRMKPTFASLRSSFGLPSSLNNAASPLSNKPRSSCMSANLAPPSQHGTKITCIALSGNLSMMLFCPQSMKKSKSTLNNGSLVHLDRTSPMSDVNSRKARKGSWTCTFYSNRRASKEQMIALGFNGEAIKFSISFAFWNWSRQLMSALVGPKYLSLYQTYPGATWCERMVPDRLRRAHSEPANDRVMVRQV
jgi:hypothetical protein